MANQESVDENNHISRLHSVSGKMSMLVVGVILCTTLLLTTIDYVLIRANIRDEIHIELRLLNQTMRGLVQSYLAQQSQLMELVVTNAGLRNQLQRLNDQTVSEEEFREAISPVLADISGAIQDINELQIVDPTGKVLATTDPALLAEDVSLTGAFANAPSEIHVELSGIADSKASTVSAPIVVGDDELAGVVVADVDAASLMASLGTVKTDHESTRTRIANRDQVGKVEILFASHDKNLLAQNGAFLDSPLETALSGDTGFLDEVRDYRDRRVIAAYMPVGYSNWVLVTQIDVSDAYGTIHETFYTVVICGILFSIVAALVATFGVHQLLRPINRLAHATKRVAAGEYRVHVNTTNRRDEVESLARTFNSMSDQVAGHTEQLESTVKERTSQVERSRDELRTVVRKLEGQTDLMQRDLRRAEAFQKSLLPKLLPELEGFSISALYHPGRILGGDLYDVIELDEDHVAMLVADAAGHGASAAMLSVLFKLRISSANRRKELLSPKDLFARVNDAIVEDVSAPGVFVTALVCIVNTRTRDVVISSAGHPPLLVVRASGEIEEVTRTGQALGLQLNAKYGERRINLINGDCLLLYTDGLFDVGSENPPLVEDIVEVIRQREPGEPILKQLMELGSGSVSMPDRDDTTLLMLEVSSEPNWVETDTSVDHSPSSAQVALSGQEVRYIEEENHTVMYLIGRVTWFYGQAFFDAATSIVEEHRPLLIEMDHCSYLDSAMLGTLYEIVEFARKKHCDVILQNTSEAIRQAFDELGLTDALAHITDTPIDTPDHQTATALRAATFEPELRLLHAHEVLADLNEQNREAFTEVIDGLKEDITSDEPK